MEVLRALVSPGQVAAGILAALMGLGLVARFFARKWMERMEADVRGKAPGTDVARLEAEVVKLREDVHRAGQLVSGVIGNVVALDEDVARYNTELGQVRQALAEEVRRLQDAVDELQREVWSRKSKQ